jgi:sugar transferase EpsL
MKRLFDVVASACLLVILAPILILIVMVIAIRLGRPVLFTQERPGLKGNVFHLHKFRSMSNARDSDGEFLPDDQRLDAFGRFLRSTSLDELPELWDVMRGRMSLVGPRPLLPEYLPLYDDQQARRHDVRPGITGWAQVKGRNSLSWERKFELDVWYVENRSMLLDIRILFMTIGQVMRTEETRESGFATMTRFRGNDPQ